MSDLDIAERRVPQDGRVGLTHRRPPRRPARRDAAQRPRRVGRHAHPRQGQTASSTSTSSGMARARARRASSAAIRQAYGAVLVTGPTGSGKSTSLYAALGRDQHAREEHHHDRGPGRAPGRRHHAGPDQPEGRPDVRHRPALDDARRPRRDHGRRDPRPRDGADRRRGRAHRPPRPLDAAHERRADGGDPPHRDGHRAVPRLERDRLRRRPAPRAHALPALQDADDHPRRGPARPRLPRPATTSRPTSPSAARAAAAAATRAASASTRSWRSPTRSARSRSSAPRPTAIAEVAVRDGMRRLREDGLEKVRHGRTSIAEVARVTSVGRSAARRGTCAAATSLTKVRGWTTPSVVRACGRFNRTVTQRVGALAGRVPRVADRPLGASRVLWEVGGGRRIDVRALRARLDLDSGYLSRLLRAARARGPRRPSSADAPTGACARSASRPPAAAERRRARPCAATTLARVAPRPARRRAARAARRGDGRRRAAPDRRPRRGRDRGPDAATRPSSASTRTPPSSTRAFDDRLRPGAQPRRSTRPSSRRRRACCSSRGCDGEPVALRRAQAARRGEPAEIKRMWVAPAAARASASARRVLAELEAHARGPRRRGRPPGHEPRACARRSTLYRVDAATPRWRRSTTSPTPTTGSRSGSSCRAAADGPREAARRRRTASRAMIRRAKLFGD